MAEKDSKKGKAEEGLREPSPKDFKYAPLLADAKYDSKSFAKGYDNFQALTQTSLNDGVASYLDTMYNPGIYADSLAQAPVDNIARERQAYIDYAQDSLRGHALKNVKDLVGIVEKEDAQNLLGFAFQSALQCPVGKGDDKYNAAIKAVTRARKEYEDSGRAEQDPKKKQEKVKKYLEGKLKGFSAFQKLGLTINSEVVYDSYMKFYQMHAAGLIDKADVGKFVVNYTKQLAEQAKKQRDEMGKLEENLNKEGEKIGKIADANVKKAKAKELQEKFKKQASELDKKYQSAAQIYYGNGEQPGYIDQVMRLAREAVEKKSKKEEAKNKPAKKN